MEPADASRARDRNQPLEFRTRDSNPRLETGTLHERTPLRAVRPTASAVSLVHCGMGKFVANDFLQERRWTVEEEISDSDLSNPRNVEAQGNTHTRACG